MSASAAAEMNAPVLKNEPGAKVRVGFIIGPTGVGKSGLALQVAERLGGEIVNADSRLFYSGMDTGTAKPPAEVRRRVPHHLIDLRAPDDPIDVADFLELARQTIAEIASRGRPPIVVGGSGLYLRVLRGGIFGGAPASPAIRAELYAIAREKGTPYLHAQLREIDPDAASRILPNDLRRIVRALEVFRTTRVPISIHQHRHRFADHTYETMTIGLNVEREHLYQAINRRFDEMVAAGLVEEVRALLAADYRIDSPPLCTIGYRQIAAHLRGELSLEEAIALAKRDTRRLAKRQLTWFRADPSIIWIDAQTGGERALAMLRDFFCNDAAGNG
jgi:tRNA dimethylallyltransferase